LLLCHLDFAIAHVADEPHDVGLHVLRHVAPEARRNHLDDRPHCFAKIGRGVFQVCDRRDEQRLGLGIGFLIEGQAGTQLVAAEQLAQAVDRIVQRFGGVDHG
jgi:hypothetical protein